MVQSNEYMNIYICRDGDETPITVSSRGNLVSLLMCGTEVSVVGLPNMKDQTASTVLLNFDQGGLTVGWIVEQEEYTTVRIPRPDVHTPSPVIPSPQHGSRSELDYSRFSPKTEPVSEP